MLDRNRWHAYMVLCSDGTFYAGIARNLQRRIEAHNSGKNGAKYTRGRRPVRLVFLESFPSRSAAARREHQLKKMTRAEKRALIHSHGGEGMNADGVAKPALPAS